MATQKQINSIISEILAAEEPESVTNDMVGEVLDHLSTVAVNQATELETAKAKAQEGINKVTDAAAAAASAASEALKANTKAQRAYDEAIAAEEMAVAACPIQRALATENKVDELTQTVDTLTGRHNSLADQVAEMPKFLPIDGQLTEEYIDQDGREPDSGVWLVPSPDEGCWYFRSYGDTGWYGHAEEEYNADFQYIPDLMYILDNQIAVIENDRIKIIGSHKVEDADSTKLPGLYELPNGEPLLVSRYASKKTRVWIYTQIMLSDGAFVTRTGSVPRPLTNSNTTSAEIEWEDWQTLQGGGTEGAIVTDEDPDNITEPNTYLVNGKDILIVSKTTDPNTRQTVPSQIRITGNDIKTRAYINNAWEAWSDLTSVAQAKTLAGAAKGAIATTDGIDTIVTPQVYTMEDGSTLIVSYTAGDRPTTPMISQFKITGSDIQVRATPAVGSPTWSTWQSLLSVKTAQAAAEAAQSAANTAQSAANTAQNTANTANSLAAQARNYSFLGMDGVGILYCDSSAGNYSMLSLEDWVKGDNSKEPEGVVICQGARRLVINYGMWGVKAPFATSAVASPYVYPMADALNDWDGLEHAKTIYNKGGTAQSVFKAMMAVFLDFKSPTLRPGRWWLPSLAELLFIYANIAKINFLFDILGIEKISGVCWSSTEMNDSYAYTVDMSSGKIKPLSKTTAANILGVTYFLDEDLFSLAY